VEALAVSEDEFSLELRIKARSIKATLYTIILISFLGTVVAVASVLHLFYHP